jgi:hypothetical protein
VFTHNEDGAEVNIKISSSGHLGFCCTKCKTVWISADEMVPVPTSTGISADKTVSIRTPVSAQRRMSTANARLAKNIYLEPLLSHLGRVSVTTNRAQIKLAKNLFPESFAKTRL